MNRTTSITTMSMLTLVAVTMIFGSMSSAHAASAPNAPAGPQYPVSCANPPPVTSVTGPSSFGGLADYECVMLAGKAGGGDVPAHSWDEAGVYSISNQGPWAIAVSASITDCCLVGDHYSLYKTTDSTLNTGWSRIMSTPQVATGPQLVAPTFNPLWNGNGTTYSTKTATIIIPAGSTVFLRVNDDLFTQMGSSLDSACSTDTESLVTAGCSVSGVSVGSGWTPAGFTLGFN